MGQQTREEPSRFTGSNAGRSRAYNRGLVLSHVRASGQSGRAEIARASGLTTQTVSNIIAELQAEGYLCEAGQKTSGRGLPAMQYKIAPHGRFALGIELRPNAIRAAVLDLSGQCHWGTRLALHNAAPENLVDALQDLRRQADAAATAGMTPMLGAGVVLPGPFGATGLSGPETELPGWEGLDRQALFSDALDLPVVIENDANAAAIAERIAGVAQGLTDYALIYFGTGIGLGMVMNSALIRGGFGNAGELGHLQIGDQRLEDIASRLALARRMASAGLAAETAADLDAPQAADVIAEWAEQAGPALGLAVTILENLLDPQAIIFGGALPDAVLDRLIAQVPLSSASVSRRSDRRLPRICRGGAGQMTATLGAGALVIDRLFTASLER